MVVPMKWRIARIPSQTKVYDLRELDRLEAGEVLAFFRFFFATKNIRVRVAFRIKNLRLQCKCNSVSELRYPIYKNS